MTHPCIKQRVPENYKSSRSWNQNRGSKEATQSEGVWDEISVKEMTPVQTHGCHEPHAHLERAASEDHSYLKASVRITGAWIIAATVIPICWAPPCQMHSVVLMQILLCMAMVSLTRRFSPVPISLMTIQRYKEIKVFVQGYKGD